MYLTYKMIVRVWYFKGKTEKSNNLWESLWSKWFLLHSLLFMARLHCHNVSVRQCAFAIFELNIQNDCSCLMLWQKKSVILWNSLWSKLLLLHSLLFMASLHCRCICSLMCFCDFLIVVISCKVINKWFNSLKP